MMGSYFRVPGARIFCGGGWTPRYLHGIVFADVLESIFKYRLGQRRQLKETTGAADPFRVFMTGARLEPLVEKENPWPS